MLWDFLSAHPYLAVDLVGLPGFAVLLALSRGRRLTVLFAGALLVPFAPLAALHEGGYWQPTRLGGMLFGLEDVLYLFLTGSVAWAFAAFGGPLPRIGSAPPARAAPRLLALTALAAVLLVVTSLTAGDAFAASMAVLGLLLVGLVLVRPGYAWPAAFGAAGYTAYHLANTAIGLSLWPHFADAWQPESVWSLPVATLPLGEIVFAPLVAATHVLALAWILEPRRADDTAGRRRPSGRGPA